MSTIPDAAIEALLEALEPYLAEDGLRRIDEYPEDIRALHGEERFWGDPMARRDAVRRAFADLALSAALPHLTPAPQAEGDVREAVDWTRESEHGRCGEWQREGVPSRCALRVSHQGRHDFERSSSGALVDHIRMSVPAMLPGIAQRIAGAVLSSGLVVPVGEVEGTIADHMQRVAHRVMDVFEEADGDTLADEVMADLFAAIGLTEAFGADTAALDTTPRA